MSNLSPHDHVECVVIGAGVVGLACAKALALSGYEVLIIESAGSIGTGTSSRNSEVIHAGIYYPTGSLKARLCVEGKQRLYDYCRARHVPHKNCGKVIVATSDNQRPKLNEIRARAIASGVHDLQTLNAHEILQLEPEVTGITALYSPSTGIIDSHSLMETLLGDVQNAGGNIAFHAPFLSGTCTDDLITLNIGGAEPCTITTKHLINAAGLFAVATLKSLSGFPTKFIPEQYYAKGNYFNLSQKSPFTHLVYPVPEAAGLGVHATLDMAGFCRFGPDVQWVDNPDDYSVDPSRSESFYAAIRTYWPGLLDGALLPGYSGIRTKLQSPQSPAADFVIQTPKQHGINGLINLLGIESPGLTASLAIAEYVTAQLKEKP